MEDKEFDKLLKQTMAACTKHQDLLELVGQECIRRYGVHFSDVDADSIIDPLMYGAGIITVKQFDDEMKSRIS